MTRDRQTDRQTDRRTDRHPHRFMIWPHIVGHIKTRKVWLPEFRWCKNFDDRFSRFDRILACDRGTDRQTSFDSIICAMHSIAR